METKKRELYLVATVLAATLAGGAYFAYRHRAPTLERAAAHVATFLDGPRTTAKLMIERYGPPNALAPDTATWYERGPWKRITVHGDAPLSFLEQVVSYHVPADAVPALTKLDHGLRFDIADDELSATSNTEALNFLALNLAHEVASARRDPAEAADAYVKTARLTAAGKSSPYTEKLQFEPYRPMQERWDQRSREIGY